MKKLCLVLRSTTMLTMLLLLTVSCKDTDSTPDLEVIPINSVTADGVTVSLFAEKEIETGANDLYWKVEENGNSVDIKSFSITPLMEMATMTHSTPYKNPVLFKENENYYHNMAVFIMPSGEMGTWAIPFEIETMTGKIIAGEVPIEVNSSWKLTSVRDANNNNKVYFITWLAPQKPVSGNNDLMFMVHTRETMMSFPAVSDAELIVYPYMDMGGGQGHSTDFTTPVAMGDGMYEGDINYSMSGVWTTSVRLVMANDTLPEVVFEYSVLAK